jgi:pyruvate formate lyase activating enzyme
LANVFVTNGYMTAGAGEMLETSNPHLDAASVDLKAFRDQTYRQCVGARLQPVLDSMKKMKQMGVWLEVTTLIIPDFNDDPAEVRDAARFVARELGSETAWHISRFFPAYQMTDVPPTPLSTIQRAQEIGRKEGLHHIYAGNVLGEPDTSYHVCGRLLIGRSGYRIAENHVGSEGRCPDCDTPVSGVGMQG